jgi:hypothetical protein
LKVVERQQASLEAIGMKMLKESQVNFSDRQDKPSDELVREGCWTIERVAVVGGDQDDLRPLKQWM